MARNTQQSTGTPAQSEQQAPKPAEFDAAAYVTEKGSKSAAIRALLADGKTRAEVAKMLGLRYQHVRNVAITPVKKAA